MGNNLVDRRAVDSCHLVQCAYIEPGNRKYLHHHVNAETIWVILDGEGGDICHSLPVQWHGMGNTGTTRLRYLSIEGPMPYGGAFDTTVVCEGE